MSQSTRGATVQQLTVQTSSFLCCASSCAEGKKSFWDCDVTMLTSAPRNPVLCLVRVRSHIWVPSGWCINSTFSHRSPCKAEVIRQSCFHPQDRSFVSRRTTRILMLNALSRWSSIPPKCISVIGERLCWAASRTLHQDFWSVKDFWTCT